MLWLKLFWRRLYARINPGRAATPTAPGWECTPTGEDLSTPTEEDLSTPTGEDQRCVVGMVRYIELNVESFDPIPDIDQIRAMWQAPFGRPMHVAVLPGDFVRGHDMITINSRLIFTQEFRA